MVAEERARSAFLEYRRNRSPEAMARVFDACAQELLLVAHHLARTGVSPEDLVQATFLEVMRTADDYDGARPLMPWMLGVLANVARTHNRKALRRPDAELLESASVDDPADLARAQELVQAVAAAIEQWPDPQRTVLTLGLIHGLSPTEIAHALGRPVGSVKSWLHRGVRRLKQVLPPSFAVALALIVDTEGSLAAVREQTLAAARAHASGPRSAAAEAGRTLGGSSLRWSLFAGSLVIASAGKLALDSGRSAAPSSPASVLEAEAPRGGASGAGLAGPAEERRSVSSSDASAVREGTLLLKARYASDGAPATLQVALEPRFGDEINLRARSVWTDEHGEARVEGLAPGLYQVLAHLGPVHVLDLPAQGPLLEIEIPAGRAVSGRVFDPGGRPLPDATLWLSQQGWPGEGALIARTDAEGRYRLRDIPPGRLLWALAGGFAPAPARAIPAAEAGARDASRELEFRLPGPGGALQGRVLDEDGSPIAGAYISCGRELDGPWTAALADLHGFVPPQRCTSDREGRFELGSLPRERALRVWVRAPGLAARALEVDTSAATSRELEVTLRRGAIWEGRADGLAQGASALFVHALPKGLAPDPPPRWGLPSAYVRAGAAFALPGLAPGLNLLMARDDAGGRGGQRIEAGSSGSVAWSPQTVAAWTLAGRVRSEGGELPAGLRVRIERAGERALLALVDAAGNFEVPLLDGRDMDLWLHGPIDGYGGPLAHVAGVSPWSAGVELVLPRARIPSAWLQARVLDAAGKAHASVSAASEDHTLIPAHVSGEGEARIGPLPPGRYHLGAYGERGLELLAGPFELAEGEVLDVGELRARAGGEVRVSLRRADADAAPRRGLVRAAITTLDGVVMPGFFALSEGAGTSGVIPAGRYLLTLLEDGVAFAQRPIEVLEGSPSEVELSVGPTLRMELQIEDPRLLGGAWIHTHWKPLVGQGERQGELRLSTRMAASVRGSARIEVDLAPGTYELQVRTSAGSVGAGQVEVRADRAPRVHILELR